MEIRRHICIHVVLYGAAAANKNQYWGDLFSHSDIVKGLCIADESVWPLFYKQNLTEHILLPASAQSK